MLSGPTSVWRALEDRMAWIFLAAGTSFLVVAAINGLDVFTPIETQEGLLLSIEGATGFGGAVLFFVAVMALYPRLAGVAPRLARGGLVLALGPGIFFVGLFTVCSVLAPLLGFPSLKAVVPSFGLITATVLVSFAIAVTIFGVACLRTAVPSRTVGGLLLVVALSWFGIVGAIVVFRYHTPVWVTFLETTLMAGSVGAIGLTLRSAVEPTGRERPSGNESLLSS